MCPPGFLSGYVFKCLPGKGCTMMGQVMQNWGSRDTKLKVVPRESISLNFVPEAPGSAARYFSSSRVCRSVMSNSATPQGVAPQGPPSMGFSRQECMSGFHLLLQGILLTPGIKPRFPALQADSLPSKPTQVRINQKEQTLSDHFLNSINHKRIQEQFLGSLALPLQGRCLLLFSRLMLWWFLESSLKEDQY